jgi:hypothetical protein
MISRVFTVELGDDDETVESYKGFDCNYKDAPRVAITLYDEGYDWWALDEHPWGKPDREGTWVVKGHQTFEEADYPVQELTRYLDFQFGRTGYKICGIYRKES